MSQLITSCMAMVSSIMFSSMTHPMSMGVILLVQTALLCLMMSTMSVNSWFSYILFLVFLGGVLVLFIYMTSVASNELFNETSYSNKIMMSIMLMAMIMTIMLVMDPTMMMNNSEETTQMMYLSQSITNSMFNYPNNMLTYLMVLYLFLTLIVVVKMTESQKGPLRTIN